jgi:hypothetical protein
MELTRTWHELYGVRYSPLNIVQPLFAAGTIYLLSGLQAVSGARVAKKELKHSYDSLKLCMQYLREISKSWGCASTVESILRGLIEERLRPAVEKRSKPVVPRLLQHHAKSASEGGDAGSSSSTHMYLPNPPSSRRSTSVRRPRVHQAGAGSVVTSPMHSPTISVHPAMDDDFNSSYRGHSRHHSQGFGSQQHPTSASQELLSPWSTSPTQPIPIRGGGSSNGSSSSGSPVSVRLSASPGGYRNASMLSSSPTTPELQQASPAGSFIAGNSSMPQSYHGSNDNNVDPFFGPFNSFDGFETAAGPEYQQHQGQTHHHQANNDSFDLPSIEVSQYFAMLGGQPLPAMPFVGPIPNSNNSEPADGLFNGQQLQQHGRGRAESATLMDFSDLDFSLFTSGAGPEHLTGEGSEGMMGGYYPPFGGGSGVGAGLSSNPADFAFPTRRAVSENFRTGSSGAAQVELFNDFDFTADYQ